MKINVQEIMKEYGFSEVVAKLLAERKPEKWMLDSFLNGNLNDLPDPALLPNIREIKHKIMEHIKFGSKICIAFDMDTDGSTSGAIMYKALKRLNGDVFGFSSNRHRDGYGTSKESIDIMKDKGAGLILMLDFGISEKENIEYAKSLGMDVIVLDHHEHDDPPDCLFIDLKVNQGMYPFKVYSAAGLVWSVCQYLLNDNLYELLDIVTMSTIGDLVPLYSNNRYIVKEGLKRLTNTTNLGLIELKRINGLLDTDISTGNVAFTLSPCINAHQRLKFDNNKSFEMLTTNDVDKARSIAQELYELNEKRKEITKQGLEMVKSKVNPEDNIVIIQGDFPSGIVGLIASDIMQEYSKPSIVFGTPVNGYCKGSARSINPLHIRDALKYTDNLLENFGGHSKAAGCSIQLSKIDEFRNKLLDYTKDITYEDIKYDMELDTKHVTMDLAKELEIFQPCGIGNPSPKFLFQGELTDTRAVGKDKSHLQFKIDGISGIAFGAVKDGWSDTFIGTIGINEWRGKSNVQIMARRFL